jgi:zinc/manganese transport system permease protein
MSGLDVAILGPAFVAGLLILLTHVPLGREVIQRGIIFIDLAIAQIAALGLIIANSLGFAAHGWEVQLIAVISALIGALLLSHIARWLNGYQEAIIGVVFVLAATASIIFLAHNPHGGEHLKELLVGQILWVEWQQLIVPAIIAAAVLGLCWFKANVLRTNGFYPLFAIAITAAVQLVGVYLVFASLIIPALATIKQQTSRALVNAFLLGTGGYALGLISSAVFDLPSGAVIVWCMALLAGGVGYRGQKTDG